MVEAVCTVDRAWLVQLGQDPDTSRMSLEQAITFCQEIRVAHGRSTLPLRYAQVELSAVLGLRDEALEQLREARLFSFGKTDTGAVLATARMHDDYSGVISTTTATPTRAEPTPWRRAGAGRGAGSLPGPPAHRRGRGRLRLLEPAPPSGCRVTPEPGGQARVPRDVSSQWQRAIALIRHSPMKAVSEASAWQLMNTAVGLALVMRAANRADVRKARPGRLAELDNAVGEPGAHGLGHRRPRL